MTDFEGRPSPPPRGRVVIAVSRYHERVTRPLLDGARQSCRDAGVPDESVDVLWVPGAFELGVVAAEVLEDPRTACLVVLGCIIRGETPHFDYVAGGTSRVLADLASQRRVAVGFGLLTCDTLEQALARAGGSAGNKGYEAAEAALATSDVLAQLRTHRAQS